MHTHDIAYLHEVFRTAAPDATTGLRRLAERCDGPASVWKMLDRAGQIA